MADVDTATKWEGLGVALGAAGLLLFPMLGLLAILAGVQVARHGTAKRGAVVALFGVAVFVVGLLFGSSS